MKRFMLFFGLVALFAPMPWGLALNHNTEECAGFWGGDECMIFVNKNQAVSGRRLAVGPARGAGPIAFDQPRVLAVEGRRAPASVRG